MAEDKLTVVRPLPFVELMELLEFSRLRLEHDSEPDSLSRGAAVVGSQDWIRATDEKSFDAADVYVCSTVGALQDAALLPENTQLRIKVASKGVRLQALQRRPLDKLKQMPCLRVDLPALIHRVIVPEKIPAHLFELIRHVVLARIWVDVVRVCDVAWLSSTPPRRA